MCVCVCVLWCVCFCVCVLLCVCFCVCDVLLCVNLHSLRAASRCSSCRHWERKKSNLPPSTKSRTRRGGPLNNSSLVVPVCEKSYSPNNFHFFYNLPFHFFFHNFHVSLCASTASTFSLLVDCGEPRLTAGPLAAAIVAILCHLDGFLLPHRDAGGQIPLFIYCWALSSLVSSLRLCGCSSKAPSSAKGSR